MDNNYNGVINLYKEKGMSSHTAVGKVRYLLGKVKGGHTGTLDPEATGVLPIVIGRGTKLSDFIMAGDKIYRATLVLGVTTDTQDTTGVVLTTSDNIPSSDGVLKVIKSFECEYYQMPPMFSAIKIGGQKLYELARKGIEVEREKRLVNIFSIDLVEIVDNKTYVIDINCSKGTYIRALCNDIGEKLNCGGTMGSLTRLKTGIYIAENSITLEELGELVKSGNAKNAIISMEEILIEFPKYTCNESANKYLYNGNPLNLSFLRGTDEFVDGMKLTIFDTEENLIGLYQINGHLAEALIMLYIK